MTTGEFQITRFKFEVDARTVKQLVITGSDRAVTIPIKIDWTVSAERNQAVGRKTLIALQFCFIMPPDQADSGLRLREFLAKHLLKQQHLFKQQIQSFGHMSDWDPMRTISRITLTGFILPNDLEKTLEGTVRELNQLIHQSLDTLWTALPPIPKNIWTHIRWSARFAASFSTVQKGEES